MGSVQMISKYDKIIITLKLKEKAMKKKLLKCLCMLAICFAFIFLFIPKESFAASGDWMYNAQNQTLTNSENTQLVINNVTADGNSLTIGANQKGSFTTLDLTGEIRDGNGTEYSITSIDSQGFYACSSLTNIELPNTLTSIGDSAFESCEALKEIVIPDSVTSMGG